MRVTRFIDSLSFNYKITFGFLLLILIMTLGLTHMLKKYTDMSDMTTDIIDRYHPITNITSDAIHDIQEANRLLNDYLLNHHPDKINAQTAIIMHAKDDIELLIKYAEEQKININKEELSRAILIIDEIQKHVARISSLGKDFNSNYPVINYATVELNPIGREYMGFINEIIADAKELGLNTDQIVLLTDIRQSWSQMMSNMKVVVATRSQVSVNNVYTYSEVNNEQFNKLKDMDLDLGVYSVSDLGVLRDRYLTKLEHVRELLTSDTWREDHKIMTSMVMPLFSDLVTILNKTLNIEIKKTEGLNYLIKDEISKIDNVYFLLIISAICTSLVISVFISRNLRRPLRRLVLATKKVAQGDLDTHLDISSGDEIAQLNDSFNEMVDQLKLSHNNLLDAMSVAEDAKLHAEEASEAKSEFLRSMSHELRTPMNSVLGYSQMLAMDSLPDHQKQYVSEILNSGKHLLELINQVLDLARIDSGDLEINLEDVDLSRTLNESLHLLGNTVKQSTNITIVNNVEERNLSVIADQLSLRQILINLLANAIKYNKENGSITINADELDDNILKISITDTGIGLTEEEVSKIFEPFQRLSFMGSTIEGSGIGLTVTRKLIEQLGGEIGVESKKGIGSTFWFTLSKSTNPVLVGNNESLPVASSKEGECNYDGEVKRENRILYIEDNKTNIKLVEDILSRGQKLVLTTAETAEEGLALIETINPDIILMDINLPDISGLEALKIIRANEKTRDIPVIAVSANAMNDDISAALEAGFNEYIIKPIDIELFKNTIEKYCTNQEDEILRVIAN